MPDFCERREGLLTAFTCETGGLQVQLLIGDVRNYLCELNEALKFQAIPVKRDPLLRAEFFDDLEWLGKPLGFALQCVAKVDETACGSEIRTQQFRDPAKLPQDIEPGLVGRCLRSKTLPHSRRECTEAFELSRECLQNLARLGPIAISLKQFRHEM